MLASNAPSKIAVPFGNAGSRNVIPVASQIGVTPGAASFTDGFPPLTYTDPTAGGIAPSAQDVNGILYAITNIQQWQEAGTALPMFDAAFSAAIGGYPNGAMLQSSDGVGLWISQADNNTVDPATGGNWVPLFCYGNWSTTLAGLNVTLSTAQANKAQIILTGSLTANVTLTFPTWQKQWLVLNYTTGSFTVNAKTSAGSPTLVPKGASIMYGDGLNIVNASFLTATNFTSTQNLVANGWAGLPGGLTFQWGNLSFTDVPAGIPGYTGSVTFPIPFPTTSLGVFPGFAVASGGSGINNFQFATTALSTTGFSYQIQEWAASVNPGTLKWFSVGY